MKTEIEYLISFRDNMVKFLDELIEQFPHEASFILIRIFVKDKIPITAVLGRFMMECLPYKKYIKDRNDTFFLNSDMILNKYAEDAGLDRIDRFREMWTNDKILDTDDKQVIWDWFDLFFNIAINYYKKFGPVDEWEFDLEKSIKQFENSNKN